MFNLEGSITNFKMLSLRKSYSLLFTLSMNNNEKNKLIGYLFGEWRMESKTLLASEIAGQILKLFNCKKVI